MFWQAYVIFSAEVEWLFTFDENEYYVEVQGDNDYLQGENGVMIKNFC